MGAVAYLPWIHFESDFCVGEFEFLRVDARSNTVPKLPKPYDQIVNVSLLPNNRPIREFTVVKKLAGSLIDDLTEADIESLYQIVELVILAGISTRDISGHYYVNSENFNLYIQRFDIIPINHLSIRSKRRGAALWNGYPIGLYSDVCSASCIFQFKN